MELVKEWDYSLEGKQEVQDMFSPYLIQNLWHVIFKSLNFLHISDSSAIKRKGFHRPFSTLHTNVGRGQFVQTQKIFCDSGALYDKNEKRLIFSQLYDKHSQTTYQVQGLFLSTESLLWCYFMYSTYLEMRSLIMSSSICCLGLTSLGEFKAPNDTISAFHFLFNYNAHLDDTESFLSHQS